MKEDYKIVKINDFKLLKDKVYEAIKNSIIQLSLPPNEPLVEQRLAENLGVSKSPIREALLRLEREGLVYTLPFRGCFVAQITKRDIHEVFHLREALETFCVKRACEDFSEEQKRGIKTILQESEEAMRQNDIDRCYEGNIAFHDFLITEMNNERIIKTYETLRHHLDRYRNIASLIFGRVAKSHQEHVLTFKAIEERDGAQAEKKMADHLRSVLEDFLNSKELRSFCC